MKPKEKILESSFALFREKGFQATGIAEILERAGAYKKTLYDHFKSKDDIGFEYLNYLSEQQRIVMLKVLSKANDITDFIDKWVNFIVRNQRNTSRKDCPIALFSGEISHLHQFDSYRNNAVQHVLETVEVCILKFEANLRPDLVKSLSYELYMSYLGGLRLYALTKDRKVIERMKAQMMHSAQRLIKS
ncbi:transcriptional regulator, TetR family [Leptospira yanagawae serovar Saopaulo str. Sao Paulo = ATCC 700523]|uniref:Transcriptional regulator, TetR family n=1 Tax=Leptospira yanagawae serovar Saopaulo str. Sao Paulo = ATCC 700523 TaxID=1249483 RepID=A0A5E8HCS1_9LEPT|nr:TetR/AcrR family transcriptional regulator [Leptospira yanagawae]EOQ88518.1 transcriptional regulator, TetR family [Leptospira yanagawae serovar Saopaulo str. Sao Paulo = ATCC 700523]